MTPIVGITSTSRQKMSAILCTNTPLAPAGRAAPPTNSSTICKKKRGDGGYQYKAGAIAQSARAFSEAISASWLASANLVPAPPSKIKTDAAYDDRMYRVCLSIRKPEQPAIRELIEQIESTETFKGGHRLKPEELRANYRFAESQMENLPETIGIIDDVLTTGSHFRAMKDMLLERAPNCRVVGFFIARRAIPNPFGAVSIEDLLK
jgi:predicted amidophosphoribosyltransferase